MNGKLALEWCTIRDQVVIEDKLIFKINSRPPSPPLSNKPRVVCCHFADCPQLADTLTDTTKPACKKAFAQTDDSTYLIGGRSSKAHL